MTSVSLALNSDTNVLVLADMQTTVCPSVAKYMYSPTPEVAAQTKSLPLDVEYVLISYQLNENTFPVSSIR